ncbi:MAG: nucleotide exchange factor GrpE [Gammaproteobacteria bacterium]|nr:MAG: nucleotide exchange factor GrpE [Gammaproteobacteria bacterium]
MSTDAQKTALLEEFQGYLEQSNTGPFSAPDQPDLYTLLSELTGLKTEVKAESRQFKNTLDTLSSALETVQSDNKFLSAELDASIQRHARQHTDAMRSMLLEMVDIYDRLSAGVDILQNYRPVNALFKHSRKKDVRFIERYKEGQIMSIRRFEQLLHSHQVRAIDCVGKLFDPLLMSVLEIDYKPALEKGIVLEELRKGFFYKDQVLRLAEVKVNKTKAG